MSPSYRASPKSPPGSGRGVRAGGPGGSGARGTGSARWAGRLATCNAIAASLLLLAQATASAEPEAAIDGDVVRAETRGIIARWLLGAFPSEAPAAPRGQPLASPSEPALPAFPIAPDVPVPAVSGQVPEDHDVEATGAATSARTVRPPARAATVPFPRPRPAAARTATATGADRPSAPATAGRPGSPAATPASATTVAPASDAPGAVAVLPRARPAPAPPPEAEPSGRESVAAGPATPENTVEGDPPPDGRTPRIAAGEAGGAGAGGIPPSTALPPAGSRPGRPPDPPPQRSAGPPHLEDETDPPAVDLVLGDAAAAREPARERALAILGLVRSADLRPSVPGDAAVSAPASPAVDGTALRDPVPILFAAGPGGESGAEDPLTPPIAPDLPEGALLADPDGPVQVVRTLRGLQDDIARGAANALAAQDVLLARIDAVFAAAPPETWRAPRNARALAVWALSGGNPVTLRRILGEAPIRAEDAPVLLGALAFLEGREADARRHFENVEAGRLAPTLAGPVALAKAALAVGDDPRTAERLLDVARLSAPGTLVDEAALRRAILIAADAGELDRFERLVGQYLRRFRHSVYAGNFRRRFVSALTRMPYARDPASFDRLERLMGFLDAGARRELHLAIARAAIESGRTDVAERAASEALVDAPAGGLDRLRGELYLAAALTVDLRRLSQAAGMLAAIDPERLPAPDRALHRAALSVVDRVGAMPEVLSDAGATPTAGTAASESGTSPTPAPDASGGAGGRDAPTLPVAEAPRSAGRPPATVDGASGQRADGAASPSEDAGEAQADPASPVIDRARSVLRSVDEMLSRP